MSSCAAGSGSDTATGTCAKCAKGTWNAIEDASGAYTKCAPSTCDAGMGTQTATGNIAATTDCADCLAGTFAIAKAATCSKTTCAVDNKVGTATKQVTATADCTACAKGETSTGGAETKCKAASQLLVAAVFYLLS